MNEFLERTLWLPFGKNLSLLKQFACLLVCNKATTGLTPLGSHQLTPIQHYWNAPRLVSWWTTTLERERKTCKKMVRISFILRPSFFHNQPSPDQPTLLPPSPGTREIGAAWGCVAADVFTSLTKSQYRILWHDRQGTMRRTGTGWRPDYSLHTRKVSKTSGALLYSGLSRCTQSQMFSKNDSGTFQVGLNWRHWVAQDTWSWWKGRWWDWDSQALPTAISRCLDAEQPQRLYRLSVCILQASFRGRRRDTLKSSREKRLVRFSCCAICTSMTVG